MTPATIPLPPTPVLEMARLTLRPLRIADTEAIQRIFPQWEVVRWLNGQIPWPYPPDGAASNVVDNRASARVKEKQGAVEIAREAASYVSGPAGAAAAGRTWLKVTASQA
jgi:RimJ/RimL family protein N-acetyltransferase